MPEKPDWLTPMFPWPQRVLAVNGRRMAYIDEGPKDARPVLLLHGNPTWSFLYRDFVEPLKKAGYRVIAPDCIGAGYSDKPRIDAAYTLAHHIADLVSLIDQLDLKGFAMVAQDWGGPQGVGAALQRPGRLAALTLMNTWLYTDYKGRFHTTAKPWTSWHAPIIGAYFMKRKKVLSHGGASVTSKRGMSAAEARRLRCNCCGRRKTRCFPSNMPTA
jgi:haloalkane dehalogenase